MAEPIGELLVRENLINMSQLKQAQDSQRQTGERLAYTLTKLGMVSERDFDRQFGRNQVANHAGNVAGAALSGWLG